MDIIFDKPISQEKLKQFLIEVLPCEDAFLIYDGINGWENAPNTLPIMHYQVNEDIPTTLKYGLSVYVSQKNDMALILNWTQKISKHFKCSAMCDASGLLLNTKSNYYALLFSSDQAFLVDDSAYEESGEVIKIIKLNEPLLNDFFNYDK
ncbi:hypothetical protein [Marinicella rhabdoformis]|uniref:hypothetical protein n=1 Tax=Marinicella rhabdoformis TaxID=2580566 RepID=UPI0012AED253|nr:hypothetical protein [Marinicella rhabdoformis]